MTSSSAADRLLGVFLEELDERLTAFDRDLLALEGAQSAPDQHAEIVQRLFRGAHSIKGAAAAVGLSEIELLCHKLEDRLAAARDGQAALDRTTLQSLFTSCDKLREIATRLGNGKVTTASNSPAAMHSPVAALTAAAAAPPAPLPATVPMATPTVRVTAERLDRLIERSGELIIAQHAGEHRIEELRRLADELKAGAKPADVARALQHLAGELSADRNQLATVVGGLDNDVRTARLVPFAEACVMLERVVRDTAQATGKRATLHLRGADIELDRGVADALRTPLTHLTRNAVDHGIESPARRQSAGKPPDGHIEIVAALSGNGIVVEVSDDGAGLDLQRLRERARERGVAFADNDPARIVFLPGISTATTVSTRSGRGVGLDAVQTAVAEMRGHIDVQSTPGLGTRFLLKLPPTLTTLRVVLFRLGGQTFALDEALIRSVLRLTPEVLASVEGRPVVRAGAEAVPFIGLDDVLGLPRAAGAAPAGFAIIVDARDTPIALAVDTLLEDRVVVIRSLGKRLSAAPAVSGASLLGDGTIAPILRNGYVIERALAAIRVRRPPASHAPEESKTKRVLLVDDSVTTRALERSILEAAGFAVITAGDGAEAWRLLESTEVDAIVSDVDMPNMTGFELTATVRSSPRLRDVPVVLVTARETAADRQRGIDAGADAYIVKSSFDQHELLETLRQLA